jgi:hypothetical protein
MKLRNARNHAIVTVKLGDSSYAVAEARELKAAGFGARQAAKAAWWNGPWWPVRGGTLSG